MIRFGLIGTNIITEQFIEAASSVEYLLLTGVYSRTEKRANEFAQKFNIPNTFTDLEVMAKSPDIDAVYIASPNSFHAEQAILLMKHGKHILCEKPIASNSLELQEMIKTAKENQVLLMEALKTTFTPNYRSIQNNLHKIGQIRRIVVSYCQYSSRYDAYKSGQVLNTFNPVFSNGALMDIGIYCIYPVVTLFGRPQEIKANGILLQSGVDGQGSIIMHYEDKEAVVTFSKITNSSIASEIQGENGNIIIDQINVPQDVKLHYKDGTIENITEAQTAHPMYYEIKEFVGLLKKRALESSINSFSNSLTVAEIMEEARKQIGLIFPADNLQVLEKE
ncbi:Gfo/Idh/MocA family oxidoreductase [Domibacillus sp. DTU_2020_1001157_1_SI_ALB_TIR_016]|uniref:Gfo/Idh/MocA family protein n=1 Tax=Domibacillus sp. DTU_2020_1001157_1_SI_ALB_TIR_016 TaxID=3077789 RepID=UPI0028EAFD79|nr:Gfo/Idh/MocA family oxidoreductase [Domibacillus sp. DTU_2020_1001157_1_SI_ALB_TIR_016]WNS78775.1 Gfo/Idh/MocA family oxidoreductase [Domibacillus sp. DTU_2020_1001157_1_SI_ALB_TIR_016]